MRSSREGAARSPMEPPGAGPASITERDDPLIARPAGPAGAGMPTGPSEGDRTEADAEPLTESGAEAQAHGICFKTGPPERVGVELEWLVCDSLDPVAAVDQQRVRRWHPHH
jgi:hypothetical protein